jgi:glutaredoxin-like protein
MDEKVRQQVAGVLADMDAPVRLLFFTQEHACGSCRDQREILQELAHLSEKIRLDVRDLIGDGEEARRYGVDKIPATVVLGERDYGIRFFGVAGGYEFTSLLEAVLMVSQGEPGLAPEVLEILKAIDRPVHLEVMVTPTCPYCAKMVHLAHQFAMASEHIRADMVESSGYPHLVQRYRVTGVPKTVIDEVPAFEGTLPPATAALEILRAVDPESYARIEARLREERGERVVTEAREDRLYDVLIVGAGPAALSAAVYAVRKGLDTLLLGEHLGGQITDTAVIENWLGIPAVGGNVLAGLFRDHAERYAMAERLRVKVRAVEADPEGFRVVTADGQGYRGRAVVYSAGKEYRRLGVPGEARFIGNGIAFCATCDAPLYRDRRVAVVGGGNSAFTAARDLVHYASEIHIIHVLEDFQADPVLVEEVRRAPQVVLHLSSRVREFLGDDRLTGVRIESADGATGTDLAVEGVFLEIGLEPNTDPVQGLVPLNGAGEIPVGKDQSTAVPGFFAAGDVTDEPEKQIVVAAGAGAKAALAAGRYLDGIRRTETETGAKEGD